MNERDKMKERTNIQRNSSIEALKIIAVVLIVLSHSMPDKSTINIVGGGGVIDIDTVTADIQLIIAGYIKNLGQIGNDIFLVCSSWFLLESRKVKLNKISNMIGDCFFISIFMLGLFTAIGYDFSVKYIIKQFFPVTFGNCWFLTCYILLYAVHPLLNFAIKEMSKEQLLCFNVSFFMLHNCIGFAMRNVLFYYSHLIGFIGIYFFTAYLKFYMRETASDVRWNKKMLAVGVSGWIASSCLTAVLGYNFSIFESQMQRWNSIMNPCFILIAMALFHLFRRKEFHNRIIDYLSGCSLLIYMIHTTRIMRDYVRYDIFAVIENKFGCDNLIWWILLFAIFNLTMGTLGAIAYKKTIQKYIHAIFEKISGIAVSIYHLFAGKILTMK